MADNALLANIFSMVTKSLAQNQQSLNQADDQNHDHGTNMVNTFQTITRVLNANKNAAPSTALTQAAKMVSKEGTSGSAKLYAQGLAQAAQQVKGQKTVDPQMAVQLLQTLIGGGQAQPQPAQAAGGDLLGSLLGSLGGAQQQQQAASQQGGDILGELLGAFSGAQQQPQQQQAAPQGGGDLLGELLGGLTGGGAQQQPAGNANNGLDMGDLLNAGMAFMQAKQGGGSNASALMQAVMAGSGMGNTNHRAQSTQLVVNSFMQALGALTAKK